MSSLPRVLADLPVSPAVTELVAGKAELIPWEAGAGVTPEELAEIVGSLRAWQLGETSDGSRLIRTAYGPFQLGHLAPGAVDEVGPKVLREQLGVDTPKAQDRHANRRRQA